MNVVHILFFAVAVSLAVPATHFTLTRIRQNRERKSAAAIIDRCCGGSSNRDVRRMAA